MPRSKTPEATAAKISAANRGRKMPREIVERLAEARRGRKLNLSEEQRQAMRDRQLGRRHTEESKAKISAANKGREIDREERFIRSAVAKVQMRGEALNARIAADPVLAQARRENGRRQMALINAKRWGLPASEASRSDVDSPTYERLTGLRGPEEGRCVRVPSPSFAEENQ